MWKPQVQQSFVGILLLFSSEKSDAISQSHPFQSCCCFFLPPYLIRDFSERGAAAYETSSLWRIETLHDRIPPGLDGNWKPPQHFGGMYIWCTHRLGVGRTPKADAVRKLSKGGYVKMQIRGEGVKKIRKSCRRRMYMAPYIPRSELSHARQWWGKTWLGKILASAARSGSSLLASPHFLSHPQLPSRWVFLCKNAVLKIVKLMAQRPSRVVVAGTISTVHPCVVAGTNNTFHTLVMAGTKNTALHWTK